MSENNHLSQAVTTSSRSCPFNSCLYEVEQDRIKRNVKLMGQVCHSDQEEFKKFLSKIETIIHDGTIPSDKFNRIKLLIQDQGRQLEYKFIQDCAKYDAFEELI